MNNCQINKRYINKVVLCLIILSLFSPLRDAISAEFFYDAQGRLIAEKDETGKMAVYTYDAVGNLLSIDNFEPTVGDIGIFLLLPQSGVVGSGTGSGLAI